MLIPATCKEKVKFFLDPRLYLSVQQISRQRGLTKDLYYHYNTAAATT
jgi:hypothetical protein